MNPGKVAVTMGKIIFWIVVIFAVLFVLRMLTSRRRGATSGAPARRSRRQRRRRWCGASNAACSCRRPKRACARGLSLRRRRSARPRDALTPLTRSLSVSPRCSPRPRSRRSSRRRCPARSTDSGRRILWIVGIYRAVCGAMLLRHRAAARPARRSTSPRRTRSSPATGLYFLFGLVAFWWVQQERLPMSLPQMLFALLAGDVFFLALVMIAGGQHRRAAADPAVPAARGERLAAAHADGVLPRRVRHVVLLGLDAYRVVDGKSSAARSCSRRASSASATSRRSASRSRSAATPSCRKSSRRSAASTSPISSR